MKNVAGKVGVLAIQGGFIEHEAVLRSLGADVIQVRSRVDLAEVDKLVIPGGESTVMSQFLDKYDLGNVIVDRCQAGSLAVMGTCAGAILLAKEVKSDSKVEPLGLMDTVIERNAYGTQIDSFVTELDFAGELIKGMFIRAPKFLDIGSETEVLISHDNQPVLLRNESCLAATFHPELVGESAIHGYFLSNF